MNSYLIPVLSSAIMSPTPYSILSITTTPFSRFGWIPFIVNGLQSFRTVVSRRRFVLSKLTRITHNSLRVRGKGRPNDPSAFTWHRSQPAVMLIVNILLAFRFSTTKSATIFSLSATMNSTPVLSVLQQRPLLRLYESADGVVETYCHIIQLWSDICCREEPARRFLDCSKSTLFFVIQAHTYQPYQVYPIATH